MSRWNTFHTPVQYFLSHGQDILSHGTCQCDETGTDPSHKDFFTVETTDDTKVGRDWKVVKSEYVSCKRPSLGNNMISMMITRLTNLQVPSLNTYAEV